MEEKHQQLAERGGDAGKCGEGEADEHKDNLPPDAVLVDYDDVWMCSGFSRGNASAVSIPQLVLRCW